MRPGDRGYRGAPRLEARSLRKDRAASVAAGDSRVEHVGPFAGGIVGGGAFRRAPAFLRHPLLQSAALHASGGNHRGAGDRSGVARRARNVPDNHARQGRDPRQGHAEFHRQPHRHFLGAGDDEAYGAHGDELRCRGCADRSCDRAREKCHLSHCRRGRVGHDGARGQDNVRHASRRPVARAVYDATGVGRAGCARGARRQDQGWLLSQGRQGDPGARSGCARLPCRPRVQWRPKSRSCSRSVRRRRNSPSCADPRIRRRSSCGRSSAISFTTVRITCGTSPTMRATSTSPFAGVSAGRWARSRPGRPRAGRKSLPGSRRTSRPARHFPVRRCRIGSPAPRCRPRAACTRRTGPIRRPGTITSHVRRCRFIVASNFPIRSLGERADTGTTMFETDAVRMWQQGDDIGIVSFKSKGNTIGDDVLDGLNRALDEAERNCAGLVIWQTTRAVFVWRQPGGHRAGHRGQAMGRHRRCGRQVPADLIATALQPGADRVRGARDGAGRVLRIHHALRPRGRGVRVLCRPGGSRRRIAAWRWRHQGICGPRGRRSEARRQRQPARPVSVPAHVFPDHCDGHRCQERAGGQGTGLPASVGRHRDERLRTCCTSPRHRPGRWPSPDIVRRCRARNVPVAGKTGLATLQMLLVNMREGGFISAYDFEVGLKVARVLCGGELEPGSLVDENWFIELERREFMNLLRQRQDAGADRAHACDRQAAPKLRTPRKGEEMSKQMQDAYIVASTRTAVGKAPRGAYKSTRPDTLLAHVLQRVLAQVPATRCQAGRRRHRRLRDARIRTGDERRADRLAAGRASRERGGHDDQPVLLVRTQCGVDRGGPDSHR